MEGRRDPTQLGLNRFHSVYANSKPTKTGILSKNSALLGALNEGVISWPVREPTTPSLECRRRRVGLEESTNSLNPRLPLIILLWLHGSARPMSRDTRTLSTTFKNERGVYKCTLSEAVGLGTGTRILYRREIARDTDVSGETIDSTHEALRLS